MLASRLHVYVKINSEHTIQVETKLGRNSAEFFRPSSIQLPTVMVTSRYQQLIAQIMRIDGSLTWNREAHAQPIGH